MKADKRKREEARRKTSVIIQRKLDEYKLLLTMENIRRMFAIVWKEIPKEDVILAIYKILKEEK